jgi:hypothetical protein
MTAGKIVELLTQLRAIESASPDFLGGIGPARCETCFHRNPEGPQAADMIEQQAATITSLTAEVEKMRDALPIFERVTRLADTLASDVPITAEARKHITRAYEQLAALAAIQPTDTE